MDIEQYKKIIQLAISNEIEAQEFYKSAAEKIQNTVNHERPGGIALR